MTVVTAMDLATTGLPGDRTIEDPDYPRMVQLSGVLFTVDGCVHGRAQDYIQQDKRTSKSAENAHGITDTKSRTLGIPEPIAVAWFTNRLKASDIVTGWALPFDLDIIRAALIRMKKNPVELIRPGLIKVDLQELMTPIMGKQAEDGSQMWPKLSESYEHLFSKPVSSAGTNADACREIFMELHKRGMIEGMEQAA